MLWASELAAFIKINGKWTTGIIIDVFCQSETMKNKIFFLFILILSVELRSESAAKSINPIKLYSWQDPARTSDNAKINPDKNLDGSGGRYKNDHKHANGKKFATNKRHIKTAKPNGSNGKEGKTTVPKGSGGS